MKKLPTQVFMVADLTPEEKKLVHERGEKTVCTGIYVGGVAVCNG
jgi:hypothetical protein